MSFQATILNNVLEIRTFAGIFMTDTCTVCRKSGETVINGENIIEFNDREEIPCRLIIRSGNEATNIAAQERLISQASFTGIYRLQIPYTVEVDLDDRIELIDIEHGTIRTFEVVFVPPITKMTGAHVITIWEIR